MTGMVMNDEMWDKLRKTIIEQLKLLNAHDITKLEMVTNFGVGQGGALHLEYQTPIKDGVEHE